MCQFQKITYLAKEIHHFLLQKIQNASEFMNERVLLERAFCRDWKQPWTARSSHPQKPKNPLKKRRCRDHSRELCCFGLPSVPLPTIRDLGVFQSSQCVCFQQCVIVSGFGLTIRDGRGTRPMSISQICQIDLHNFWLDVILIMLTGLSAFYFLIAVHAYGWKQNKAQFLLKTIITFFPTMCQSENCL